MKRGLFRDFSGYYKNKFSKYVIRYNNLRWGYYEKNAKMELFIQQYISDQHSHYFKSLEKDEQILFVLRLKELLFSNRYKKVELFLKDWDFGIVRKLLYSFSTNLRNQFLSIKHNSYLIEQYLMDKQPELHQKLAKDNQMLQDELDAEISTIETLIHQHKV